MDQNTNQGQQAGGASAFDPFAQQAAGGGQTGGNPTGQDPTTGVTPPWLSFSADPAVSTPVDPFANDPFATPTQDGAAPMNPWEQAEQPTSAPSMSNPWDVAEPQLASEPAPIAQNTPNPWDTPATPEVPTQPSPSTNPWDTPAPTPVEPWAVPTEPAASAATPWDTPASTDTTSIDTEEAEEDTSGGSVAKKSSEELLAELKRRFEEEEGEVEDEIKIHEENIKMEQEAIRNLKASRRTQVSNMKHMFEELKTILKIEEPKPEPKPEQKPQPKPHNVPPRPAHQAPRNPNFPPRDKPREQPHKPSQPAGEAA